MIRTLSYMVAIVVTLVSFTCQTKAAVVYSNGGINGTLGGYTVGGFYNEGINIAVSNSFTSSNATSLTSAEVGLWVEVSDAPQAINWSVGTTPFASDVSSGTASLTNTYFGSAFDSYSVFNSRFSISGNIGTGTFYFTLYGGITTAGGNKPTLWDQNNGPSVPYQAELVSGMVYSRTGSEAFTLYGSDISAVPEPSTMSVFGLVAIGVVGYRKRRLLVPS